MAARENLNYRLDRTEISITIDTEFSIAGAFRDPVRYPPIGEKMVYCYANGQEQGLGFLLDLFSQFQTSATFFVETANYHHFGDGPMQGVVKRIQSASQDIQLHIHPIWFHFSQDPDLGIFEKNDSCVGRGYRELKTVFESCIDIFERWVGKRPDAIRTGSLYVDHQVYRVMGELGVPLASNIGLGLYRPENSRLHLQHGRVLVDNVMEVPVFSYNDSPLLAPKNLKTMQITSCTWPEIKKLLWQARKMGISNVVILTHPFEFVKRSDLRFTRMTRNRVNQKRISKLCQFINEHDQDFVAADFGGSKSDWLKAESSPVNQVKIPDHHRFLRKLHNGINDKIWLY